MSRQITTSTLATVVQGALGLSTALAQAPPGASAGVVQELMRQPLADQPGTDVVVITVDYPPGGTTLPHEHPGYTYAYVLEGTIVSQLDDQPPQTFFRGTDVVGAAPSASHGVKERQHDRGCKLLVFFITPHGEKLTEFLPAK
jgi:quercetin dioxygenase-like cupin family protein